MKVKQKSKSKRYSAYISVGAIVIATTLLLLEVTNITHLFHKNATPATKESIENSNNKKEFLTNNPNSENYGQHTSSNDITINTVKASDGSIVISTELRNFSDGTCDLSVKLGGATYTDTADVIYQPSYSTCAGFSIPANALPSGTWDITLKVTSKGKTSVKSTNIKV